MNKGKEDPMTRDQEAHQRIDEQALLLRQHAEILTRLDDNISATCMTLRTISEQMKPVTRTLMVAGWCQKFIVWLSPMVLLGVAVYSLFHAHV